MKYSALLVVSAFIGAVCGQVPLPSKPLGFTYGKGNTSAPIQLSAFLGPLCPDSLNAFPTLLQVADHYGSQNVRLITHQFPLPYHRNSFLAAKGAQIVDVLSSGNQTYRWLGAVYAQINEFSNDATHNKTESVVQAMYASIATSLQLSGNAFNVMYKDSAIEESTRLDWKYTATRGVAWTPAFMINDVLIQAEPTWTLKDWSQVIDGLLGSQRPPSKRETLSSCKIGTKTCEYLPGKVECCTKGEACIPNVGCRC
ncbi:uncharacterized protein LOC110463132 [Mizuhopecten yessoensis]|uniref:Thioredoxin-like fold domain-containing protein n=1 Tax=Mizuhopecten yessoensis TaxID=6573 RepID=A0A210PWW9_MIZYE|nr:uncharacterized protein LOC110463132 [Mizuhopecten yessoensis]OWF40973.1 hypothetical protein KP79_PYT16001 [Mizuhopecten yessoensis]